MTKAEIMENIKVLRINNKETHDWLMHKHYAKRIPSISFSFGLFKLDILVGVCCFGRPVSHSLVKGSFGGKYQNCFLELNRLIVNEGLKKNTLSFFVSKCIKLLPKPKVIVSYADTSMNHNGYIYQATNFVYTGLSAIRKDYKIKGLEHLHSATIMDKAGKGKTGKIKKIEILRNKFGKENIYKLDRPRKHRYFYFHGSKTEKKKMKKTLCYKIKEFPKGKNKNYSCKFKPKPQLRLF